MLNEIVYIMLALATLFLLGGIETEAPAKRTIYAILSILFSIITAVGVLSIEVPGDTIYTQYGLQWIFLFGYSFINVLMIIIAYTHYSSVSNMDQVLHR